LLRGGLWKKGGRRKVVAMKEDGMHLKTIERSYPKDGTWDTDIDVLIS
jgi:hypothetical protein